MSNINLVNISKAYAKNAPKAVENLDIEIADGEFLCLLGPSGCGKTTTLRMLAGLEHPTDGKILIDGKPIVSVDDGIYTPPEKRGLGLVFQSYALWPHLSVEENVAFGLRLRKVPQSERDKTVAEVMETLSIAQYRDRYPSQLSGGQQQRVALARTLATRPGIILLDEPLSNLDAKLRLEMRAELKRIHREMGATIIFVTHDQWEAMTLATTIAVMSDGTLQQLGNPTDIYERPANRFVAGFVGSMPINFIDISHGDTGILATWTRTMLADHAEPAKVATVGIRPEAIRVLPEGENADPDCVVAAGAHVNDVLPNGGSWIIELLVEGRKVFAITESTPSHRAGDAVNLAVERGHLHLFDSEDNRIATA